MAALTLSFAISAFIEVVAEAVQTANAQVSPFGSYDDIMFELLPCEPSHWTAFSNPEWDEF